MVHEKIAGGNRIEHVGIIGETRGRKRCPWRIAKLRDLQAGDLEEARVIELSGQVVNFVFREPESLPEQLAEARVSALRKFQAHHGFVATLPDLLPHQLTQPLVAVVVKPDFGVASQAKERRRCEPHAGVQLVCILPDDVGQTNEHALARRGIGRERNPRRQLRWDLDARVDRFTLAVVVQREGHRQ
jgi:hypothetical protein